MPTLIDPQLHLIGQRWPALHAQLLARLHQPEGLPEARRMEGPHPGWQVEGLQLASRHDPEGEARIQAATLPDAPHIHLYGPALGGLPRELLHRRMGLQRLSVHLLNKGLFLRLLQLTDQSDWLADPRVELDLAAAQHEVDIPFFAHPAELVLADDAAARLRDRLITEITLGFIRRTHRPENPVLARRLADHQAHLGADRDVAELFDRWPGRPAVVIGTGPTLESQLPRLRRWQQQNPRPLLIAADTALVPLECAGVQPDIVVSIDWRTQARFLQSGQAGRITLVYAPVLDTDLVLSWPGPRYCAYGPGPLYDGLRSQLPRASLFQGGSVIHPAIDLARRMGARHVTLLGTDFCFPGGRTHAHWGPGELHTDLHSARLWSLNGRGQRVPTQPNFASYRVELERYIAQHPEVRFVQGSADSAQVEGCILLEDEAPCD